MDQMLSPKHKRDETVYLRETEIQGHGEVWKCCSLPWKHDCLPTREQQEIYKERFIEKQKDNK